MRPPTLMPRVMAAMRTTTITETLRANTKSTCHPVRRIVTSHTDQHTNNTTARGTGATDGTSDSMDFASRIRVAKHGAHRNAADIYNHTDSIAMSDISEKPSSPMPAFHQGHDGHHSQSALNSPTQQHHEVMPDRSYRNGPSIESGSS